MFKINIWLHHSLPATCELTICWMSTRFSTWKWQKWFLREWRYRLWKQIKISLNDHAQFIQGQPACWDETTSFRIVDKFANPLLAIPGSAIVCLINFTCRTKCTDDVVDFIVRLYGTALSSSVCKGGLVACPSDGTFEIMKCVGGTLGYVLS